MNWTAPMNDRPMTDPKAIDISPEAVGAAVKALGDSRDAGVDELAKLLGTLESARDGINLIGTALMDFAGDDPHGLITVAINTAESIRVELEEVLPSPPKDPAK